MAINHLQLAVKGVQDLVELNKTFQEVFPLAVKMCTEIVDAAHLGGHYMCPGLVSSYGPPVTTCRLVSTHRLVVQIVISMHGP